MNSSRVPGDPYSEADKALVMNVVQEHESRLPRKALWQQVVNALDQKHNCEGVHNIRMARYIYSKHLKLPPQKVHRKKTAVKRRSPRKTRSQNTASRKSRSKRLLEGDDTVALRASPAIDTYTPTPRHLEQPNDDPVEDTMPGAAESDDEDSMSSVIVVSQSPPLGVTTHLDVELPAMYVDGGIQTSATDTYREEPPLVHGPEMWSAPINDDSYDDFADGPSTTMAQNPGSTDPGTEVSSAPGVLAPRVQLKVPCTSADSRIQHPPSCRVTPDLVVDDSDRHCTVPVVEPGTTDDPRLDRSGGHPTEALTHTVVHPHSQTIDAMTWYFHNLYPDHEADDDDEFLSDEWEDVEVEEEVPSHDSILSQIRQNWEDCERRKREEYRKLALYLWKHCHTEAAGQTFDMHGS